MAILLSAAFREFNDHLTGIARTQIQLAIILFFSSSREMVMLHGFMEPLYMNRNVFYPYGDFFIDGFECTLQDDMSHFNAFGEFYFSRLLIAVKHKFMLKAVHLCERGGRFVT